MSHVELDGPAETTGVGGTLSLATLANFQAYIGEASDSGGAVDTLHQTVLDAACHGAYSKMGGRFLLRPATAFDWVFSSQDVGSTLFLQQWPVGTVSVFELGWMSANGVWTSQYTVPVGEYYLDSRSGRIYGTWPTSLHSVRVAWTGGFTTVPADAKEAVMIWAGVKLERVRRMRWDQKSKTSGQEGATFTDSDLPGYVAEVFQKYSLPMHTFA